MDVNYTDLGQTGYDYQAIVSVLSGNDYDLGVQHMLHLVQC